MARRTLEAMVAAVQRRLNGYTVGLGEIVEALACANKELHRKWDWPWVYSETVISVPANYTLGSINLVANSSTITGVGTAWDTSWTDKRIMTGANNMAYRISQITSPTTMIVLDVPNVSQVGAGYIIYQDVYPMSADFEPGQDLQLAQPMNRLRVGHIPRIALEEQAISLVQFFSNIPIGYADYGYDAVTRRHKIKVIPPPGGVSQMRLHYRRMPIDLTDPTQMSEVPESFDDVLEWMATASLGMAYQLPVAQMADARATRGLKDLRRRIGTTAIENSAAAHGGNAGREGSMTQWGLSVFPQ